MASESSSSPSGAELLRGLEHLPIEDAYFQVWGRIGGAGRLRRTFSLFVSGRSMLELQIRKKHPGISDREAQWRTAQRMYDSDPGAQRLLECMGGKKMGADDFPKTIQRISAILLELGLKFHVTGGVAAAYYGDPRYTQDADFVIQLSGDQPQTKALLNRLSSGYLIHEQAVLEAIRNQSLFQAIDEEFIIKIDFHVGEKIPGELERSQHREVFPGVVVPLVSKEDAILSKLIWIRQGSHKSRQDVRAMLKRPEELDRAVLQERAARLGLSDLLAEIEANPGWD